MKRTQLKMAFLITLISLSGVITAQTLRVSPKNSTIVINGTSNLHDWNTKTDQIKGELVFSGENQLKSMSVEVPVKSIKSGERLMDSKTYETLNADKHPNIVFRMTDAATFQRTGSDINAVINGNLTIAGTTKRVVVRAKGKVSPSGEYVFSGEIALKMTDYNMKPPTAMLGALKVGDQVRLKFDVTLSE